MKSLSTSKKIIFYIIMFLLAFIVLESVSYFLFNAVTKRPYSFTEINSARQSLLGEFISPFLLQRSEGDEVIHPYLGYVYNPEFGPRLLSNNQEIPVSDYGLMGDKKPIFKRGHNKVIIGILGGSVAAGFSFLVHEYFMDQLKRHEFFAYKDIEIVGLALGGYKQPQQLIMLTYLLSLGAEFDIIINIDGFNEVALPPCENIPKNVNPYYPRNWYIRTLEHLETEMQTIMENTNKIKRTRLLVAKAFNIFPVRYSISWNIFWSFLNKYYTQKIFANYSKINQYYSDDPFYLVKGPPFEYNDESDLYDKLTDIWVNSSIQLNNICTSNNIKYFHFLQPNQYTNSKKLTQREMRVAYDEDHEYRPGAAHGYPYLIEKGQYLREKGVRYHDLTEIFSDIEDNIYIDTCCHYNIRGNRIIADYIALEIIQSY